MTNGELFGGCLSILIIFIVLIVGPFVVINPTITGTHTGYITAVDQSGLIVKNYKVYFKTDVTSSQEDEYCINHSNTDIANKAIEMQKSRSQVTIKYKGNIGVGFICAKDEITEINQ